MHPSAEIPLIAFTLLTQLGIGIMLISPFVLWGCADETIRAKIVGQRKVALALLAIGALLSMIHLGTPLHAPFTILHAGSSWLSREILLVVLTLFALAASVWLCRKNQSSQGATWLFYLAWALGVCLLYAMSQVYSSPFLPAWNGAQTFWLFLATALLLGSLWLAFILGMGTTEQDSARPVAMWRIFFFALAGFLVLGVCAPFFGANLPNDVNVLSEAYGPAALDRWRGLHALLCGIAVILLGYALWKELRNTRATTWLFLALIVGICGEISGRCAFYMAYARLGV